MKRMRYCSYLFSLVILFTPGLQAQKFLPDDPITKDPDNLDIPKPAKVELSLSYDILQNTFGLHDTGELLRAQNINTRGEVPDSSWFTNRIGIRDLTLDELARGADKIGGPDTSNTLTIIGAALYSFSEGLVVRDSRGDRYYLIFDPAGMANMATGAAVVANKFFYAAGYNVLPASIATIDPEKVAISPDAVIHMLGGGTGPLDREFWDLFQQEAERRKDGKYRVAAYRIGRERDAIGEFKFYGTRSDDPNDIIPHQARRELRGMGVFAAWLNYYHYRSINTLDRYETVNGNSYIRHYLIDFSTAFGSGNDLNGRIIPKDKQSGNEYVLWGDNIASVKTALSLGFWKRPWMKVEYPYPQYREIGRFEADFFQPDKWKPEYPNPAYTRMLPDDAFWATKIVARFSDDAIRAIVATGKYSDPAAEQYLVDTLIKRRDKIIGFYYKAINPLDGFTVKGGTLEFKNLGQLAGLADDAYYEYYWYSFDNRKENLEVISDRAITHQSRLLIPEYPSDFLMVRIRTRSQKQRGWRKNVDVYLRMTGSPSVVGIEREVGAHILDRDIQGRLVLAANVEFGGSYRGLKDEQRALVDDWFGRFNKMTERKIDPEEGYDNLPLSTRTTFDGVTHALTESGLSDASSRDLGLAIELVERIESVQGRIQGAGGDEQFRIYVVLKPDAVKILEASREFQRGADNTVYHKGYPINYRQQGKEPTIQISIAPDERRADIDVDYRSSKFPAALLNGHLTSSNSDVRAGNNYERHVNQWQGFVNWWRGLFGLPFVTEIAGAIDPEDRLIPLEPRRGRGKLEEAVEDWLDAWFIDGKPEQAMAYLSKSSFACLPDWSADNPVDYGIAPYIMLDAMVAASRSVGRVRDLRQIVEPETLRNPRLRQIEEYEGSDLFTLYEVPEDLALHFGCANRNNPEAGEQEESAGYGKYFGSVFRLHTSDGKKGGWVMTLWAKEDKHWRIISYEVDPGLRAQEEVPDLRPTTVHSWKTMMGDPGFLDAVGKFGNLWGTGQVDRALEYFAPQSLGCVNLYLQGDTEPGEEAARNRLRQGLQKVYDTLSRVKDSPAGDITEFIQPVEFTHPEIRHIDHPKSDRYSLAGLPDYMGKAFDCKARLEETRWTAPVNKTYGLYYAAAIRFNLIGEDPAVLYLLWSNVQGSWKITTFMIITP